MTKKKSLLPAKLSPAEAHQREADAIAHARETVRWIRNDKIIWLGVPLSWVSKADSRLRAKLMIKNAAAHPDGLIKVCNYGRAGWGLAHETLCDLIGEYRFKRVPLPLSLEAYDDEVIRPAAADPKRRYRRTQGQQKADLELRDLAVLFVLFDVCWKFDLKPRRNPAGKHQLYGCYIVVRAMQEEGLAKELGITEAVVESIWKKLGRRAFGGKIPHSSTYAPFVGI